MNEYKPCPKCEATGGKVMSFTWWGGLVGPKILTHVKCPSCGAQYNGKTGKDNTTGIIIYSITVMLLVGIFLIIAIAAVITLMTMG